MADSVRLTADVSAVLNDVVIPRYGRLARVALSGVFPMQSFTMKWSGLPLLVAVSGLLLTTTGIAADRPTPDPEKIFARRDTNKDGQLSLEEFKHGLQDKALELADKRFKRLDTDGNGKVSLEEFKAGVKPKPA
ncbi:MAG: EF-hand domain-containing protein [Planctomycetaceae bacterium]